jgi:hypothetical protein
MKNKSSNENMEQVFQKLAKIKRVAPETDLFAAINSRIQKPDLISKSWLRAAAAIFIFLTASEILIVNSIISNKKSKEMELLVPQVNNLLYNE